ncbi:MAG: DNA-binding response regulator [Gaiellaceae bacterium]
MTVRTQIRVLVVPSTWWWREALLRVLERSDGRFEPVAGDAGSALRLMADVQVAIVDLDRDDGLTMLAEARRHDLACVALSSQASHEQVSNALSIGASYAVKSELDADRVRHLVGMAASGDALLLRASTRFLRNLPVREPRDKYNLTPRELEVLEHLARGQTNAEIAAAMHLAPGSVKKLVSRCLTRLGVRNRVEAALVALGEGLVAPTASVPQGVACEGS